MLMTNTNQSEMIIDEVEEKNVMQRNLEGEKVVLVQQIKDFEMEIQSLKVS